MKKLMLLFAAFLLIGMQINAQTTVTGTVTGDDGIALPGVTVQVKGTTVATMTDPDGKYSIEAPEGSNFLLFTYVGMQDEEVEVTGDVINVIMKVADTALDEVVVTALGISREKKALGYSVSDVKGDQIEALGSETNAINALKGRVAGLQITQSSNMGGSSRVLLRGASSILGNNKPMYVIDGVPMDNSTFTSENQERGGGGYDFGDMAQDINPNDIESMSVLKGPSASALYGSRAANGVIIITTKRGGKKGGGFSVTVNSGITIERVAVLPDYQNSYGGGYYDHFDTRVIDGVEYNIPFYGADESWGPKLEGQPVAAWHNVYDYEQGITQTLQTSPWEAHPDNLKNYFDTGIAYKNNISFSGGDENQNFRLSYTNLTRKGVTPNSSLKRNTISFNGLKKFGKKFTASASVNYVHNKTKALAGTGYGENSIMQKFSQWGQRQWDMEKFKTYENPDGTMRTWNRSSYNNPSAAYSDNPYWTQYKNYPETWRNRLYGNINLNYEITDYLSLSGAVNHDYYNNRRNIRVAASSHATPLFQEATREVSETNIDFRLNFNKDFGENFSITSFIGINKMNRSYYRNVATTAGGLSVPDFFSIENSKDRPTEDDNLDRKRINSILGSVNFAFMQMIYVDITARNDWSSALPDGNNSYFYPSANLSFVFSQLGLLKDISWFDFGKIRGGWAMVGNDTDPYRTANTYQPRDNFGPNPRFRVPRTLNNPDLLPEKTTSWEIGLDLRFLKNRANIDLTYYSAKTTDQIIPVTISRASGFDEMIINAGTMTNKGIEALLTVIPVKTKNFSWEISINYSKNMNEIIELTEGVKVINISSLWSVYTTATVGEPYNMLRGTNFVYDDNGNKVVGANGQYLAANNVENLGSVLPDWTGGISTTLKYKGFTLSALLDIQKGGYLFSTTHMFGSWTGMFAESATENLREYGIVREGSLGHFDVDGNLVIDKPVNDVAVEPYSWAMDHYFGPRAQNVFKTNYIKLREISFGYTLPKTWFSKLPIQGATISLNARNLAIWNSEVPHLDAEQATSGGNIHGIEGGANPSTRTFGFNLKLTF